MKKRRFKKEEKRSGCVSILVIMEVGEEVIANITIMKNDNSFNPCYNGSG